jgi:hypothetical protein
MKKNQRSQWITYSQVAGADVIDQDTFVIDDTDSGDLSGHDGAESINSEIAGFG